MLKFVFFQEQKLSNNLQRKKPPRSTATLCLQTEVLLRYILFHYHLISVCHCDVLLHKSSMTILLQRECYFVATWITIIGWCRLSRRCLLLFCPAQPRKIYQNFFQKLLEMSHHQNKRNSIKRSSWAFMYSFFCKRVFCSPLKEVQWKTWGRKPAMSCLSSGNGHRSNMVSSSLRFCDCS